MSHMERLDGGLMNEFEKLDTGMKLPFDYMDKNAVAATASMMFLIGLEEKARLYRDGYYGSKEVTTELLQEFIGQLQEALNEIDSRIKRRGV